MITKAIDRKDKGIEDVFVKVKKTALQQIYSSANFNSLKQLAVQ